MTDWFENRMIRGIRTSRYVASFAKVGGDVQWIDEWLKDLIINGEHLTDEEITFIRNFAECGKCELENDAKKWLKDN